MQLVQLSGKDFKKMLMGGAKFLEVCKKEVDALNVFPVPDGDTGTNMSLTILAAAKEAQAFGEDDLAKVASAVAMGSLMGARGNSGVILSQILRGISKGFEGKAQAGVKDFARALMEGADTAYKGVLKPVEGTILTVAREVGRAALEATYRSSDIITVLEIAIAGGERALAKTPELLPVLKEVGVVDAGGKGYLVILEGALKALKGEENIQIAGEKTQVLQPATLTLSSSNEPINLEFPYCTEFLVKGENLPLSKMRQDLGIFGDSLMVVGTDKVAKVHVHSNHPGKVLEYCLLIGSLHEIKISNMVEQNQEMKSEINFNDDQNYAIIAVSVGEGLKEIFKSLGVEFVIEGGQTLNPSTEDIVKAINQCRSSKIIILPNNKNIILASEQAKSLVDKEVKIIPSKSIPQGVVALVSLEQTDSFEIAVSKMELTIGDVTTGEVTYAVRDSQYEGIEIKQGNILGLLNGKINVVAENIKEVTTDLVAKMLQEEKELITIYYGQDIEQSEAEELLAELEQQFSGAEFELHFGGQPLYYYLISAE